MDFRQIEVFIQVYRLRNFSRAGEALYLSQPTISNHISCLEDELGIKLFDRSSRQIIPTETAEIFYSYALKMLEIRESAIFSINKNKEIGGRLEIATSSIPSQYLLPSPMKSFQKKYPGVSFIIHKSDTQEVTNALLEMKYQIGIVGARLDENNLVYQKLTGDKLVLIAQNVDGETTKEQIISLESLMGMKFIVREQGSGTRTTFETALKEKGINPDHLPKVAEMNTMESIKQAVREGMGVSVMSSLSVKDYLKFGWVKAYAVEGLKMKRNFYLATHKNRTLSPCAAAFQRHIIQFYQNKETVLLGNKKTDQSI